MVLVLAVLGEAAVASFAQAMELVAAEVPATRALQQVAAYCRHVANLRSGRLECRVGQYGVALAEYRVLGKRRQCHHRPDPQPARLFLYVIQTWDRADVDQERGTVEAFL